MQQNAEEKAKQAFLWFMQENAEKYDKVSRFEKAIYYVIRLQRSYRAVIFRRVVRRALMSE